MRLYIILDKTAQKVRAQFNAENHEVAIRRCKAELLTTKELQLDAINQELYYIGGIQDTTGTLIPEEEKQYLINYEQIMINLEGKTNVL